MADQPRFRPLQPSAFFPDGASARPPVPGSVAFVGTLGSEGTVEAGEAGAQGRDRRLPVTLESLARGRQRFEINCSPCHGRTGDGNGMAVQRGFPAPPSFFSGKVLSAGDAHIDSVIANGYGRMFSYGDRVAPPDRMAIVAYIRALQSSRDADLEGVPSGIRDRLLKGDPP
ncbi:MAG: cytochrome c [Fibrobacteres bacterium]|nr:cytochrome c [Fibrobacterota bacterium]